MTAFSIGPLGGGTGGGGDPHSLRPHPYTMAQEGQYSTKEHRYRHKTVETENRQGTPDTQPGEEGRGGGKGLAVGEGRELLVQCLHSSSTGCLGYHTAY